MVGIAVVSRVFVEGNVLVRNGKPVVADDRGSVVYTVVKILRLLYIQLHLPALELVGYVGA